MRLCICATMMAALPAKQLEALFLRYFAGLEYAEIAVVMGCSQAKRAGECFPSDEKT